VNALRRAAVALLLALALAPSAVRAQSSFDTDPFASRFRERSNFDLKFKVPEKGGVFRVEVPPGEGGKQSLVNENVWEAEAPPGLLVTVTYQDIELKARKVRADNTAKTVVAEGDVVLTQGKSLMKGDRLELDLSAKTGTLYAGSVALEGGAYLKGARIEKVGPRTFTLYDGTMTACEGDRPDWSFGVSRGTVTIDDYARLHGVVFRFEGVPLLYAPYIIWPALRDRASGFLIPGIGYNSNRGGYLGLSYYWAVSRSLDATFTTDVYTRKFYGFGEETRFVSSKGTHGEGHFYLVRDRDLSEWRWETRGTIVSDDLAKNLRGVVNWIGFSDQQFFQDYNRDFNLVSARSLKSEGFLTWTNDPLSANLRLDREQALFGTSTVVTERRPVLEGRFRPTAVLGRAAFVEATAQIGDLFVDRPPNGTTPQPTGSYDRVDFFPKISVPLSAIPWLSVQANLSGRVTSYGKSLSADGTTLLDDRFTRKYVDGTIQLTGPSFSKIFEAKLGDFTRLKHVIEPRIDYEYLPDPGDVKRTPLFDEVDNVTSLHTLRYAIVQRLLGKAGKAAAREIASLEVSRTYNFQFPGEAAQGVVATTLQRNSPIDATLRVNTGPNFNFDARTTYDAHASQVTAASVTAGITKDDRSLSLSLFDSRPVGSTSSAQLRYGGGLPIIKKRLRLDVQGNYDLSQSKWLESRYLLTVDGSCFRILTEYRDLRVTGLPSRDFRIALTLKNVGSFLDFTGSLNR
jgi:LPS-assembly protein